MGLRFLLLLLLLLGTAAYAEEQPKSQPFPTSGLSLVPPQDWREVPGDQVRTIIQWVSPDSRGEEIAAKITIEGARYTKGDGLSGADALAKSWNAQVVDPPTSLDGEKAWRVEAKAATRDLTPVEAIVSVHDGFVYLIMGGVTPGHSVHEQIEAVRKSWKWTPIESQIKCLELGEPIRAFDGAVLLRVPASWHAYPIAHPERALNLAFHNINGGFPDFRAVCSCVPIQTGDTFEKMKERLAVGSKEQFKLAEVPAWQEVKSAIPRVMTQPIPLPPERSNPNAKTYLIWGLVKATPERAVLVNFTISTNQTDELAQCEQAALKVVDSITPREKK